MEEATNSVSNSPTHTSNEYDTASIIKFNHLFCYRLCRHKNSSNIDAHHKINVFGLVFQSWSFLLDSRCCDQTIHASFLVCNFLNYSIQRLDISHINTAIGERCTEFFLCALCDASEIRRGSFETVEGIDCSGFSQLEISLLGFRTDRYESTYL